MNLFKKFFGKKQIVPKVYNGETSHALNLRFIEEGKNDPEAKFTINKYFSFSGPDVKVFGVTADEIEECIIECQAIKVDLILAPAVRHDDYNCSMELIIFNEDPSQRLFRYKKLRLKAANEYGVLATCELTIDKIIGKSWHLCIDDIVFMVHIKLRVVETKPWSKP